MPTTSAATSTPAASLLQRLQQAAGRMTLTGCWLLAAGATLADQATKAAIVNGVGPDEEITLIPGLLRIIHRVNTGAAFSAFDEHPMPLLIFASMVALGMIFWSAKLKPGEEALRWPLGLIIGGAIGNLIDRFRLGHVTDFIDAHWRYEYHFPTFNVADSAICVGMGLLILFSFTTAKPETE